MSTNEKLGLVWFILGTVTYNSSENLVMIAIFGILSIAGIAIFMWSD